MMPSNALQEAVNQTFEDYKTVKNGLNGDYFNLSLVGVSISL